MHLLYIERMRPLLPEEHRAARALLDRCELPADDLADPSVHLVGQFDDSGLIGLIGLQDVGGGGLLRSLAVAPWARGRGVARALCEHLFELATARRLGGLWLLTTSAQSYFEPLGFVAIERGSVPPEIRATAQFASLCPATAVPMYRARA